LLTDYVNRRPRNFTASIDVPYLMMIFLIITCSQTFLYQLTGIDPGLSLQTFGQHSHTVQLVRLASYFMVFVLCLGTPKRMEWTLRASWPLLLLPALALASSLWSFDPSNSARKAAAYTITVLAGICIAGRYPGYEGIRLILHSYFVMLILSLLTVMATPKFGIMQPLYYGDPGAGHWRGIFNHKNILGNISAVFLVSSLILGKDLIGWNSLRGFGIGVAALCLAGSGSGSAIVCFVMMIAGYYLFLRTHRKGALVGIAAVALSLTFVFFAGEIISSILGALGKSSNLSGRVNLWAVIFPYIETHAFLGFGFDSGIEPLVPLLREKLNWTSVANAQNGYIDVVETLGSIGLAIMVSMLVIMSHRSLQLLRSRTRTKLIYMPVLIVGFIIAVNIVEAWFDEPYNPTVILFCCAFAIVSRSKVPKRVRPRRLSAPLSATHWHNRDAASFAKVRQSNSPSFKFP